MASGRPLPKHAHGEMKWLIVCAIGSYPMVAGLPELLDISSLFASVAIRSAILLLSSTVFVNFVLKRRLFYKGKLWLPILVFWLAYIGRLLYATSVTGNLRLSPVEYGADIVGLCLLPFLASLADYDPQMLKESRQLLMYALGTGMLTVWLALLLHGPNRTQSWLKAGRVGLDTLNPISLGQLGVSVVAVCVYSWFERPVRKSALQRVGVAVLTMSGLGVIIVSASRGPLLSLAAVLVGLLYWRLKRGRLWQMIVAAMVMLACSGWFVQRAQQRHLEPIERLVQLRAPTRDRSVEGRLRIAKDAVVEFVRHPIFGSGLEERESHFYPHNVVVEAFMATGLIGGGAFLIVVVSSIVAGIMLLRQNSEGSWLGLLLLQFTVAASVSGALFKSGALWFIMGATISCWFGSCRSRPLPYRIVAFQTPASRRESW